MGRAKITIKDIAVASGVSAGTVDRYIHNRGNISLRSRKLIESAIASLRQSQELPITQVLPQAPDRSPSLRIGITHTFVESSFYDSICVGINKAAQILGCRGVEIIEDHTPVHDVQSQLDAITRLIRDHNVDGLIIAPVNDNFSTQLEHYIPGDIPYATVIDDTIGSNRIFHIGPNSFAMGSMCAKLMYLYCRHVDGSPINAAIICPNTMISGTQDRISGFLNKAKTEDLNINVLSICNIPETQDEHLANSVFLQAKMLIESDSSLDAIYVTYGFGEWVARAVEECKKAGQVMVICHEYTPMIRSYIEQGIIAASVTQKPSQQWYTAICLLHQYLLGAVKIDNTYIPAECCILTKESLPLYNENYMDYHY